MVESDRPADTGHENFEPATAGPPVSGCQAAPGGNPSDDRVKTLDFFRVLLDRPDLTSAQYTVLLTMSWYATGTDGNCFATVARLAANTKMTDRGVRKILRELEVAGWLKAEVIPGRTTSYSILVPEAQAVVPKPPRARKVKDPEPRNDVPPTQEHGSSHPGTEFLPPRNLVPDPPEHGSADPRTDPVRDPRTDPRHEPMASLPLEASAPPVETKQKASKSKAPKEPNPFTEAWATAYRSLADGAAYPWGSSFHRCKAMTKDLVVKPNSELVESATRFLKANAKPTCERWLHSLRDEQVRAPLARQHATVDEMLNLFQPEPMVEEPKPEPVVHKPPAYEAEILAARERRFKPKEVSRG